MNPKFLLLLLVPPLLGWLFLQWYLAKSSIPLKNIFSVLFAPAAGFALISLSLFICYVFIPAHAKLASVLLAWIFILIFLSGLVLTGNKTRTDQKRLWNLSRFGNLKEKLKPLTLLHFFFCFLLAALLVKTCAGFIANIFNDLAWNPFGGWDARYFWQLKSRFLFRDPEQWRLLFSEELRWGNKDYPLMVPGIIAWGWHFIGREALLWPGLVSLIFACSLGGMVLWYLAAWCSWPTALIAGLFYFTLPAYAFWGGTLYCDIPYAFFSNSALLLLISALRLKDSRLLALSAFFAGCSAFTKNEGLFFIIWFVLLTAGLSSGLPKKFSRDVFLKNMLAISAGLFLPVCLCVYFKIVLASGPPLHMTGNPQAILADHLNFWQRSQVLLRGFGLYMADPQNWNGLWFLFLAAIVYWILTRRTAVTRSSGAFILAFFLINLGYALVIALGPYNIYKIIPQTLTRLLLQTGALALVFSFETFGFTRKKTPADHTP